MFYGVLSGDGRLSYCNAGQEPPFVVRSDRQTEILDTGGPVLGILRLATYEPGVLTLAPGDVVIVYSDGVTEARNAAGEEYGRDRLRDLVADRHGAEPDTLLEVLLASIRNFVGTEPQSDDITVLVLRYRG
jgi:sigma-B regulation protein RsbU (phosphoserine phosphatase)